MRKRFRHWIYGLSAILALALLLIHTPPAKRAVRYALSRWLISQSGGSAEIARLDYRLWRGEIDVTGVRWEAPLFRLTVTDIKAKWIPFKGLELQVLAPQILVQQASGSSTGAVPTPAFSSSITALEIRNGELQITNASGESWLQVGSVDVVLNSRLKAHTGTLTAVNGSFGAAGDKDVPFGPVQIDFEIETNKLSITSASIQKAGSLLQVRGDITSLSPLAMDVDLDYRLNEELANAIASELELSVTLEGHAHLVADHNGLHGETSFRSDRLTSPLIGTWSIEGDMTYQGSEIELSRLHGIGYGGTIRVTGQMDLERQNTTLEADVSAIDVERWSRVWVKRPLPVASLLSGQARLILQGSDWENVQGKAHMRLTANPAGKTIPLSGDIEIESEDGEIFVQSNNLAMPSGMVAFHGRAQTEGSVRATYEATVKDLRRFGPWLDILGLPEIFDEVKGSLSLHGQTTGSWRQPAALSSQWTIASDRLDFRNASLALESRLQLKQQHLYIDELIVREQEGSITSRGLIPLDSPTEPLRISGAIDGFDLSTWTSSFDIPLGGSAGGRFELSGPAHEPSIDISLQVNPLVVEETMGEGSLVARKRGRLIVVDRIEATLGEGTASANGTYHLDTNELTLELESQRMRLSEIVATPGFEGWDGVATTVRAGVSGRFPALRGRVEMSLDNLRLHETELPHLVLTAISDGQAATMECRSEGGRLLASGTMGLESPYPFESSIDLSLLPLEQLLHGVFPSTPADTRLRAQGELDISLPLARPEEIRYQARVDQLVGRYRGMGGGVGSTFVIAGDRHSLTIDELDLVGTDTAIAIQGLIPLSASGAFDLKLIGNARLELFNQLLEVGELEGEVSLDLHVVGPRDTPDPTGELRITNGAGTWMGIHGSDVNVVLDVANGKILLHQLSGNLLGGKLRLSGESPLPFPSVTQPARLTFEIEDVDLAELFTPDQSSAIQPLALVSANGGFDIRGPELAQITGSGDLVMLLASLGNIIIENKEAVPWSFEDNRFTLSRLHAVGGDTELNADLIISREDDIWTWHSYLEGGIDNVFLNPLIRTWDAALSGTTTLDLRIEGTDSVPTIDGTGRFERARFVMRDPPWILNDLSGELEFRDKTVSFSNISGNAGGGTVASSGQLELESVSELSGLDIEVKGDSVRLNYPDGMRSRFGGTLRLRGKPGVFFLSGEILLNEALFDRNISLESQLLSSVGRQSLSYSEETSVADTVMLDIRAQSVNDIRIDNNLAQAQAIADVKISGTLEAPEVDGVVNARPEGTFRLGRNLYHIESGSIVFRGYPTVPAELDVSARTKVSDIDITVRLRGPVDDVVMELSAPDFPSLSQGDIASLLVTGRTLANVAELADISGQDRKRLGEQMAAYLSGTLTSLAQQGLGNVLPFDTISVAPSTLETEVSPEVRFSLGKAVTEDLFVTYSIGLENVQSQLWILDYQLPKKLAFRATRNEDNKFSGRLTQQLEFDFPGRPTKGIVTDKRTKVTKVDVQGAPVELEDQLLKKLRVKPGDSFDYWTSQEDTERLTRFLKEKNHLNAYVESRWSPTSERNGILTYNIDPGPPMHIRWRGDDPGAGLRKDVLNRWDGRFPLTFLLSDLSQRLTERLMQERFFEAEVETAVEEGPDGAVEVVFDVRKGVKGKRVALDWVGNHAITDRDLNLVIPPTSSLEFYALLQRPERIRERVRLHYFSEGYVDARVAPPEAQFKKETGEYRVTVSVEEGPLAIVDEVMFEGLSAFDAARLEQELSLVPGRPFRLREYNRDRTALTTFYRREGFTSTRVRGRLDITESTFRVVFDVDEEQRRKIGEIRFVGNHATNDDTIRRQLTFKENDPLRLADLTETQKRLYELGVFRTVDVRPELTDEGSLTSDVIVRLNETPDVRFGYGLGYSTEDRLEVLTGIRFPNLFGSAHQAGLTFRINANESIFRGNYSMPYFWRYKLDTDLFLSRETDEDELQSKKAWSFTFQQHRKLLEELGLQWSYTYRRSYIFGKITDNSPFPFEFTTRQSILTTSLIGDRRNNFIRPSSGQFWNVTFQTAPEALGSDVKFVKLFGLMNTFVSLRKDWVWAASYRMGIADAFDQNLLPDNRFKAGGATTVRGFAQDSIGPVDPITETVLGGEGLAVFNQELRFPIYRWFRGVVFYDAGNVFLNASDFRLFDLRHSAGAGLRVVLPFGLLRFDYAWVLDREPGEQASRFWFNLNHAF